MMLHTALLLLLSAWANPAPERNVTQLLGQGTLSPLEQEHALNPRMADELGRDGGAVVFVLANTPATRACSRDEQVQELELRVQGCGQSWQVQVRRGSLAVALAVEPASEAPSACRRFRLGASRDVEVEAVLVFASGAATYVLDEPSAYVAASWLSLGLGRAAKRTMPGPTEQGLQQARAYRLRLDDVRVAMIAPH